MSLPRREFLLVDLVEVVIMMPVFLALIRATSAVVFTGMTFSKSVSENRS
jgi:hypothetical protein